MKIYYDVPTYTNKVRIAEGSLKAFSRRMGHQY